MPFMAVYQADYPYPAARRSIFMRPLSTVGVVSLCVFFSCAVNGQYSD